MAEEDGYKPELPSAGTSIIASHASQEPTAATDEEQSAQTGPTEQAGASHEPSEAAEAAPVQVPDIQIRHASYDGDEIPREAPAGREEAAQQDTASDPPPELPEKEPPPTPASAPLPYSNGQQQSRSGRRGSLPGQVNGSAAPSGAPQHQPPRNSTVDGSRRSSVSTTHSRSSLSSLNMGSAVFVVSALEAISSAREARKDKSLKESATRALEMVRGASQGVAGGGAGQQAVDLDPRVVFEPLRLACQTRNTNLVVTSLDCIGKLVSYSFFADDDDQAGHRGVVPPTPMNAGDGEGGADREGTAAWTEGKPLADLVTETVCDCFHEGLDDRAQLQIIKALLSTVLSTTVHVHQSSLLKAVRTVYNIFLLSRNPANQAVAQGSLTQMVHHVFGRVPRGGGGMRSAESREELAQAALLSPPRRRSSAAASTVSHPAANGSQGLPTPVPEETPQVDAEAAATTPQDDGEADGATLVGSTVDNADDGSRTAAEAAKPNEQGAEAESSQQAEPEERVTLQTFETRKSFEGASEKELGASMAFMSTAELFVKDAFLVFRALCKLSMKPLGTESERDLKSHAMRSKLLSLHLILTILKSHLPIFTDPSVIIHSASTREQTPFVQAIKQYLCLSLSRNAVSSVNQVFEISCEIFWNVLAGMRTKLKKEIEVLLNEIFLPILEMRNSTAKQKSILLGVLIRLCQDPQALVEIYLNYDCDRTALDNIYERLMNVVSKISQTHLAPGTSITGSNDGTGSDSSGLQKSGNGPSIPPSLSTTSAAEAGQSSLNASASGQSVEVRLKRQSLDCLCSVLRSLVIWSGKSTMPSEGLTQSDNVSPRMSEETRVADADESGLTSPAIASPMVATPDLGSSRVQTPEALDDPSRFENAKARKTTLLEGIRKFNFKPKRGIEFLIQNGFIRSSEPREIARFLLFADGLNKAQIGEFLGEGEPENIAIMHAFVDFMNFENMPFTESLRRFLQSFRLPGEAQKIDRFMLKFAERYVGGNPKAFANADTAYVFAYSVIMLNTDAHNPQVKHRMTLAEFIRNNSGIDDGKSLAEEYLTSVYEEIQHNEIKMKDEALTAPTAPTSSGIANAIAAVGRDLQREAYVLQSEGMANKTEALFRTMVRAQRRGGSRAASEQFFSASHFEHVKPMFEVAWMPFLAGISGPLQDSDDMEVVERCLDGFRDAIRIVCLFGLELERNAFVTTLAKFTFLNNLGEMKPKNVEAIKALLGVAQTEGNYLKGSWREVLMCVSQLERFQLISGGVDERQLPELGRRAAARPSSVAQSKSRQALPTDDVVQAGGSSQVTVAADMVFSSSKSLSGTAIVDFVQSLSDVSWEEIQSSGMTDNPRLFSLQKLVEISYYNMGRIRMEWSNIWAILGEHLNQVCCHSNANVSFFALDALRQLAVRFLEKEELPGFAFQREFLRPFEFAMRNNPNSDAREMVLQCLQQMIQSRVHNMRSGWRTMFGVFSAASRASSERVAGYAFELVKQLNTDHFGEIIVHGSFADLTVCITEFCKVNKYQKISLHAVDMLRSVVPAMLNAAECPITPNSDPGPAADTPLKNDPMVEYWYPVLFAHYEIIMSGDDLEVRRVALDSLFEILKKHGSTFRPDFWDSVAQEILFPIFAVLRSRTDVTRFSTQEDMSVWLSTTMIQALRNLIDLWTFYFETLERLLPGLLDLLCACICQENDTLARIGTSCLQQLLEKNVRKLSPPRWSQVVDTFVQLFRTTTAHQLFDPSLRSDQVAPVSPAALTDTGLPANGFATPKPLSPGLPPTGNGTLSPTALAPVDRRRAFKQIIVKCVLQLLLIETTHELLQNAEVYDTIPADQLLRLTKVLDDSYRFSKRFNADKDLRVALWKVGFMKQLPNLLKQESSSAATLVHVLVRMHSDERSTHKTMRSAVRGTLVPLGQDVINGYLPLDADTQARNIAAWTPVVAEVVTGLCTFEDDEAGEGRIFTEFTGPFYPLAVDLLGKDPLAPEICEALRAYFYKVGITQRLIDPAQDEERKRVLEAGKQNERDQRDSRVRESASIPEIQLSRPGAAPAPTSSAQEGQRRVMIEDPIPNAPTPPKSSTELPAAPEQVVDAQDSDPVADTETTRDAPQPDEEKQPAVEGEAAS